MSAEQVTLSERPYLQSPPIHKVYYSSNPINLGLYPSKSLTIGFGLLPLLPFPGMQIDNNAISPHWYNKQFINKQFLTSSDKAELLSFFPNGGWDIYPRLRLPLLTVTRRQSSFGLSLQGTGQLQIPKTLLQFILYGNRFNRILNVNNFNAEAMMFTVLEYSHGRKIHSTFLRNAASGVTLKLINGFSHFRAENASARIASYTDAITVSGTFPTVKTRSGLGYAMDYHIGFQPNRTTYLTLQLENLFGKVYWFGKSSITSEWDFDLRLTNVDLFETDTDSLVTNSEKQNTALKYGGFFTAYPGSFIAELQFRHDPGRIIYLTYLQGFAEQYHVSKQPKLSLTSTNFITRWLPVSLMFSVGGKQNFQWGTAVQLHFRKYQFNLAFSQSDGIFNYARGFQIFLHQSVTFDL